MTGLIRRQTVIIVSAFQGGGGVKQGKQQSDIFMSLLCQVSLYLFSSIHCGFICIMFGSKNMSPKHVHKQSEEIHKKQTMR